MADANQILEGRVERLLGLLADSKACERLGADFAGGAKQVVKKFEKEWPSPDENSDIQALVSKSEKTLDLMADVRDLFRAAEQIYRVFLPAVVQWERTGSAPEKFSLEGLDGEGRPIYRSRGTPQPAPEKAYLRWSKCKQGGVWAVHTDAEGKEAGDFLLDSPMVTDAGVWTHAEGGAAAKDARCVCVDEPVLEPQVADSLSQCWEGERLLAECCKASAEVLESSKLGSTMVSSGSTTVIEELKRLMEAMCSIVEKLGLGEPTPPKSATWSEFFSSLQSVSTFANGREPVWKQMQAAMPAFAPDYEITFVQCMIYMCRLLDIADIRNPSATWLLRICNRAFLRSWQDKNANMARLLDLTEKKASVVDASERPKPAGALRCVAVSDTHGWAHDLRLPAGDVLLHCGDVSFEASALGHDLDVPEDLKDVLKVFKRPSFQRYTWIFLVGGNHDRSLHQLWAENPKRLCEELPPNLVLLQVPADLEPKPQGTCLAKDSSVSDCAEDGAVKVLPDLTVCRPSDKRPGWVIAGSGVSLANSSWSPNRAFQIIKDRAEALEKAAEALGKHKPDVILTHGPPKGHCDFGRGDAKLAEAVEKCESVKVHVFGHVHETYGTDFSNGRAFVNASISSPLYVPAAEPMVFDLAAVEAASGVTAEARGLAEKTKTLRLRGCPPTTSALEICQYFAGFMVATVLPPSAEALKGRNEARVYFELPPTASAALDALSGKPFGDVVVELEPASYDEIAKEAWKSGQWVCLFDIIPKAKRDYISNQELAEAIRMGILPKSRIYGEGPLI